MTTAVVIVLCLAGWIAFARYRYGGVPGIDADVFSDWSSKPGAVIWDVRSPEEFRAGHIRGAKNLPIEEISGKLESLAEYRNRPILLVCLIGARSGQAARLLRKSGFTDAVNLRGGMKAWIRKGLPVDGGM